MRTHIVDVERSGFRTTVPLSGWAAPRVAIVGGGLSGALAAAELLRQAAVPVEVVLIEPDPLLGRDFAEALGEARPGVSLRRVQDKVSDIELIDGGARLHLAGGSSIAADQVVLAIGHARQAPVSIPGRATLPPGRFLVDPWSPEALAGLEREAPVLLLGTGLTALDLALSLAARSFNAPIYAISRHGLLPPPQDPSAPLVKNPMLSFLRQVNRFDGSYSDRPAPEIAEKIERLQQSGRLTVFAGRVRELSAIPAGVRARLAIGGAEREVDVQRVIQCTGLPGELTPRERPLASRLLQRGIVRLDPDGEALDATADGALLDVRGVPSPVLWTLDPPQRAVFSDHMAVPEISVQVQDLARRIHDELRDQAAFQMARMAG
jgi:uncharacterized NAD(P)/FAD-binding protein YdhS